MQAFTYAFELLVQRDVGGSLPQFLGSRTVSMFLAVVMMIVMTVLAARNITGRKTVQVSGLNNPKVRFPTPNFKMGTYKDSFYSQMFVKSENRNLIRLGQFIKNYDLKDARAIIEHLQRGKLDAAVINTLTLALMERHLDSYSNIQYEDVLGYDTIAFALTKG